MTAPAGRYRVVLVESVPSLLDALRWALAETPDFAVVAEAGSGVEAVALAERLQPDLVIVDTGLRPLDGYAVTRILKELPNPPAVLLLAPHSDAPALRRAREAGSDGIAGKDSNWEELLAAIRHALDSASAPTSGYPLSP